MSVTPSTTVGSRTPYSLRAIVGLDTGPGILYTSNFANQWMEAGV